MKHTEEQMMAKAKKILLDLQGEFYNEKNIEGIRFQEERPVRGNENITIPCWVVFIHEPLFDSSIFLTISDETGEPLYIQNKHGVAEIEKNSKGKYI